MPRSLWWRPSAEASGLIARAAEHLVLIAAGVDPYGVIVVEAGHAESGSTYSAGLGGVRGRQHRLASRVGCCAAQQQWLVALSFRRRLAAEVSSVRVTCSEWLRRAQ